MRSWLVVSSLLFAAVAVPTTARAELGGGTLKVEIRIPADPEMNAGSTDEGDFIDPTDVDEARYLNLARCTCDNSGTAQNYLARISWDTVPTTSVANTQLYVYTGTGCEMGTVQEREGKCTELTSIPNADDVTRVVDRVERLRELLTPNSMVAGCDGNVVSSAFGLYTSTDGGTTLTVEKAEPVKVDMRAPEMPETVSVNAEEGQITVSWDQITSGAEDFEYFQAICAEATGALAHTTPTPAEIKFDTTEAVCGASVAQFPVAILKNAAEVDGTTVDFGVLPADVAQLKEAYLCGEALGASRSITLGNLKNNTAYVVVVVAMDQSGNYTARYIPKTISPKPVTDFWEDVNNQNDELEGGLCLIESTFGAGGGGLYGALRAWRDDLATTTAGRWLVDRYYAWGAPLAAAARSSLVVRVVAAVALAPLVVVALAWHVLGLPLLLALVAGAIAWRRRRQAPTRRLRLVLAGALLASPALAAAQSTTPYWDDAMATSAETTTGSSWHVGVRLGPFLPGIDDDRFTAPGPYERMFGKGSWMPTLDVDRVFDTRFGQFGAGLSVGYFSKTADAYLPCTQAVGEPPCVPTERAPGNDTTLKVLPFELVAIYRASQLDDHWGIPLVPYARGGLAYSLWWVRRPDGDLSKACSGSTINPCDRGIGGSLGLVGAVGLAIRAERIDPDAARSMRDSGLEHAGFYGEVSASWVDGFGSAKKLSLGDTTWSAGVDFEF